MEAASVPIQGGTAWDEEKSEDYGSSHCEFIPPSPTSASPMNYYEAGINGTKEEDYTPSKSDDSTRGMEHNPTLSPIKGNTLITNDASLAQNSTSISLITLTKGICQSFPAAYLPASVNPIWHGNITLAPLEMIPLLEEEEKEEREEEWEDMDDEPLLPVSLPTILPTTCTTMAHASVGKDGVDETNTPGRKSCLQRDKEDESTGRNEIEKDINPMIHPSPMDPLSPPHHPSPPFSHRSISPRYSSPSPPSYPHGGGIPEGRRKSVAAMAISRIKEEVIPPSSITPSSALPPFLHLPMEYTSNHPSSLALHSNFTLEREGEEEEEEGEEAWEDFEADGMISSTPSPPIKRYQVYREAGAPSSSSSRLLHAHPTSYPNPRRQSQPNILMEHSSKKPSSRPWSPAIFDPSLRRSSVPSWYPPSSSAASLSRRSRKDSLPKDAHFPPPPPSPPPHPHPPSSSSSPSSSFFSSSSTNHPSICLHYHYHAPGLSPKNLNIYDDGIQPGESPGVRRGGNKYQKGDLRWCKGEGGNPTFHLHLHPPPTSTSSTTIPSPHGASRGPSRADDPQVKRTKHRVMSTVSSWNPPSQKSSPQSHFSSWMEKDRVPHLMVRSIPHYPGVLPYRPLLIRDIPQEEEGDEETSSAPHRGMTSQPPPFYASVMTWNILAERFCRPAKFPHIRSKWAEAQRRAEMVLGEILHYLPNILCLQEVEEWVYDTILLPGLEAVGYTGLFRGKRLGTGSSSGKESGGGEGLAILWSSEAFSLLPGSLEVIQYNQVDLSPSPGLEPHYLSQKVRDTESGEGGGGGNGLMSHEDDLGPDDHFSLEGMHRDRVCRLNVHPNMAIMCVLEEKRNMSIEEDGNGVQKRRGRRIRLVNTHLLADPTFEDARLLQGAILLERLAIRQRAEEQGLEEEGEEGQDHGPLPKTRIILAADLNTLPDDPLIHLLQGGRVGRENFQGADFGRFTAYPGGWCPPYPIHLDSAYVYGKDMRITTRVPDFFGAVDWIFYQKGHEEGQDSLQEEMRVRGVLGDISVDESLLPHSPLPPPPPPTVLYTGTGGGVGPPPPPPQKPPTPEDEVPMMPNAVIPSDHLPIMALFQVIRTNHRSPMSCTVPSVYEHEKKGKDVLPEESINDADDQNMILPL
ncbi:MAG: hypothetical protein DHS80DRAFT_21073 [Piptocephalis tieghemiana]|nr:MAG: hypothetical protein DHS80DRAFT_21073 [Piptocephalis tieghemiana]